MNLLRPASEESSKKPKAVRKEEKAYTSPSTALNQNVSLKV